MVLEKETALYQEDAIKNDIDAAREAGERAAKTANGKNTCYRQAGEPSGMHNLGDIWFKTDDGNALYQWDGSKWVAEKFGENAIAELAIKSAHIQDAAITNAKISGLDAGKITTGKLEAERINVKDIFAQDITATGSISGVALESRSLKVEEIIEHKAEDEDDDYYKVKWTMEASEDMSGSASLVPEPGVSLSYDPYYGQSGRTYAQYPAQIMMHGFGESVLDMVAANLNIGTYRNGVLTLGSSEGAVEIVGGTVTINGVSMPSSMMTMAGNASVFNSNFRLVSLTDKNSDRHRRAYFSWNSNTKSNFSSIPTALANENSVVGVREVYWISNIHVLVKVIEAYPVPGRTHFTFYNNGTWTAWYTVPAVRKKTLTGTTSANSNIELGLTSGVTVISVRDTSASHLCLPYCSAGGAWYAKVVAISNMSAAANTSVSLEVVYI